MLQVGSWTLGLLTAPSALFALPNCVFSADLRGAALPPILLEFYMVHLVPIWLGRGRSRVVN